MDEGGGLLFAFLLLATVGLVLMSGDQSSDTMDCPTGSNSDSICYALQNKTTTECIYSDDKDDIDDSSDDDDDDDDDDDEDHKDECTLTKNVTEYVCVCCKEWGKDENGVCSVKKNQTAPKFCENGGSLIDGVCSCLDGFTGEHCEDAICDPACQNHGVCIGRNGVPTCSCSSNFTGQYCETPICGNQCLNGASCYSYYPGIYCRCPPDYTGERCETKLKSGFCPPIKGLGICVHMCSNDSSCEGNKKCCSNGCGHVCTDPVDEPLCIYNNTYYNKTTQLYKDPCTFCTCIGIGLANNDDGFVCAVIDCALINCPNGKTIKHPDKCCAECEENTTKVAPPVFTSCPKYENVEVDDYRNYACLRYMLGEKVVAKDAYGKRLTVKFSSKSFTHCGCDDNGRNMHKVVATAMDSYGQTANCSFMVNVIDPHPPQFQSCPNNISQFNTELVQWKEPKAVDNVHIKDISIYKHMSSGNGEYFDVGVHTIIYVATDYAGNRAECIFLVVIWKRGSNDVSMPNRLKHSGEAEKRTTMVAALAAACAILVVAGVVLTLFCCHRGRARNLIRGPIPANKNGFDNKVYGQYGGALPPSYEKSVEYDAPPLYEELDTTALENPVYADPEEIKVSVEKLRLEFKE